MDSAPSTAVDVVKAALARDSSRVVIAVGLVVAYRRQKDAERAQFAQRFGAASAQLGDSDVAVRVAGVYAMAAAADESPAFARRQQCIDVLCGYLRLPYDPDSGEQQPHASSSRPPRGPATTAGHPHRGDCAAKRIRQNDREVRNTILRVLAQASPGARRTPAGPATISTSPVCSSRTPGFAGAQVQRQARVLRRRRLRRPRTSSFDGAELQRRGRLVRQGRASNADTAFAGAAFRARQHLVRRGHLRRQGRPRSTGRGSPANTSTFRRRRLRRREDDLRLGEVQVPARVVRLARRVEERRIRLGQRRRRRRVQPTIPRCITPRPWPPVPWPERGVGPRC